MLAPSAAGRTVALVSDAGMPGVSDPGSRLVAAAAAAGLTVTVVPGPSAVLAALVTSGLDHRPLLFEGFLPRSGRDRRARLGRSPPRPRTTVLFEAPGRVAATLADLAAACGGDRQVAVARELTKLHEEIWRGSLDEAVAWAAASRVRGEVVLVLAGAGPTGIGWWATTCSPRPWPSGWRRGAHPGGGRRGRRRLRGSPSAGLRPGPGGRSAATPVRVDEAGRRRAAGSGGIRWGRPARWPGGGQVAAAGRASRGAGLAPRHSEAGFRVTAGRASAPELAR